MERRAFQDAMGAIGFQHCWGCGQANEHGLRLRSMWSEEDSDEAVCVWQPEPYHVAAPGVVSGGILATLIDCHSAATAVADAARREDVALGAPNTPIYVTATLEVAYLKPTPSAGPLTLRARVTEAAPRRTTVACSAYSPAGDECARGTVILARLAKGW